MTQNPLIEYFDDWFREAAGHFRMAADEHDPEGVHDYRVALKRLKALFRLAEYIDPVFPAKKHFRKYRELFRAGAVLRDLHIQTGLAAGFENTGDFPLDEYRAFLSDLEREAEECFDRFAGDFDIERLQKKREALAGAFESVDPAVLAVRVRERFRRLLDDLAGRVTVPVAPDADLHGIRMLAKEVHYVREMLDSCIGVPKEKDAFISRLKKIHQALGVWHDEEIARDYLLRFAKEYRVDAASALTVVERGKETARKDFEEAWKNIRRFEGTGPHHSLKTKKTAPTMRKKPTM